MVPFFKLMAGHHWFLKIESIWPLKNDIIFYFWTLLWSQQSNKNKTVMKMNDRTKVVDAFEG